MPQFWEELRGTVLDGRFPLDTVVQSSADHAEYSAKDAAVTVMTAGADAEEQLEAMRQACLLQHPNLLKLLGAGRASHNGQDLLYIAAEKPERALADCRSLTVEQRSALEKGIDAALAYLHGKSLAYNNLVPETVVQVGPVWKLADFGAISPGNPVAAKADRDAFRRLLENPRWRPAPAAPVATPAAAPVASSPASQAAGTVAAAATRVAPAAAAPAAEPLSAYSSASAAPPSRFEFRSPVALAGGAAAVLLLGMWAITRSPASTTKPAADAHPVVSTTEASERPNPMPSAQTTSGGHAAPTTASQNNKKQPVLQASAKLPASAASKTPPPITTSAPAGSGHSETGRASFFAASMNGHQTASGEVSNSEQLTAAHRSYPMGTKLRVTNVKNGKSVIVRVNDRGAFSPGHSIIVSPRVARELNFMSAGSATVRVEPLK